MKIDLVGRIDSNNAAQVEEEILKTIEGNDDQELILDAEKLEYISSAGLRIILHLKKLKPELKIINVGSDIYEIFEMTGFTEMMTIEKAYRVVSVEGCEEIGRGANGTIYRIDQDNVVKVYNNADALADIQHEREVARLALVLGVPTAISYDVVKVGDSYGSVFELLNARSFSKILAKEPEKMDWCVKEYVKMLKLIHGTLVPEGKLPDMRETALDWVNYLKDHLPEDKWNKLHSLVERIPHDNHMIHGDYHTKNLELQNDEVLLIDMDTLAIGHPVFEFASIYNAFVGFSELDPQIIKDFQGFDQETANTFWNKVLKAYFETEDEGRIRKIEDKARVVGYARLIRRTIKRGLVNEAKGKAEVDHWMSELLELLDRVDSLCFDDALEEGPGAGCQEMRTSTDSDGVRELDIEAVPENLDAVMDFVNESLETVDCPPKAQMQIALAVEEIFINIASYAYAPDKGCATVRVDVNQEPVSVVITFIDHGTPYDPLARENPDITLDADERGIGGLGIFLTKKSMDDVSYEYKDGQNILTLKKNL